MDSSAATDEEHQTKDVLNKETLNARSLVEMFFKISAQHYGSEVVSFEWFTEQQNSQTELRFTMKGTKPSFGKEERHSNLEKLWRDNLKSIQGNISYMPPAPKVEEAAPEAAEETAKKKTSSVEPELDQMTFGVRFPGGANWEGNLSKANVIAEWASQGIGMYVPSVPLLTLAQSHIEQTVPENEEELERRRSALADYVVGLH